MIVNELGLVGAVRLLLVYLLLVERGFKIAMLARDSFSKLLATGLTAVFALQVFVIVGGVTRVIPLTGVTLPFISYGGSSILANFVLLALLLLVSDRARRRRERERADRPPVRRRRRAVRGARSRFTSRWTVFDAEGLRDNRQEPPRSCSRSSGSTAGLIRAGDGTRARALAQAARTARYTRTLPAGRRCSRHAVGYSFTRIGQRRPRALLQRRPQRAQRDELGSLIDRSCRATSRRATTCSTTLDPAAQRVALAAARPAARARWSRSTRAPARSR